jgi:hypothetical protein
LEKQVVKLLQNRSEKVSAAAFPDLLAREGFPNHGSDFDYDV